MTTGSWWPLILTNENLDELLEGASGWLTSHMVDAEGASV